MALWTSTTLKSEWCLLLTCVTAMNQTALCICTDKSRSDYVQQWPNTDDGDKHLSGKQEVILSMSSHFPAV